MPNALPVTVMAQSENRKIGDVATTYTSLHTCPSSCPMKQSGACYACSGLVGVITSRLHKRQKVAKQSHIATAKAEAKLIRQIDRKTDLRIHTSGDCKSPKAARIVSGAAEDFMSKSGGVAWTYTHAWRDVPRSAWGKVSVIASCEKLADVHLAISKGYAAALVVAKHDGEVAKVVEGLRLLPCPAQTDKVKNCKSCRICMRDGLMRKAGLVVTFAGHGPTRKLKAMLEKANGSN